MLATNSRIRPPQSPKGDFEFLVNHEFTNFLGRLNLLSPFNSIVTPIPNSQFLNSQSLNSQSLNSQFLNSQSLNPQSLNSQFLNPSILNPLIPNSQFLNYQIIPLSTLQIVFPLANLSVFHKGTVFA